MTQPLAIVYFQQPLPGNQLVNHLQDADYRVQTAGSPAELADLARTAGAMLVLADVEAASAELLETLRVMRAESATSHLPVIAFANAAAGLSPAQEAGATMAVETSAMFTHLPAILEQALRMD